jgi:hypothetical protein
MALSNYHFVALGTDSLLHVLRRNRMRVTDEVRRVFSHLWGPDCDVASAARVAAELVRVVWVDTLLAYQRLPVLDLVLDVLTSGRPVGGALALFRARLGRVSLFCRSTSKRSRATSISGCACVAYGRTCPRHV